MSYKIGQMRENQFNNYTVPITLINSDFNTVVVNGAYVTDKAFALAPDYKLSPNENYYLYFEVENFNDSSAIRQFEVCLASQAHAIQVLKRISFHTLNHGGKDIMYFDLIFSPNSASYDKIVLRLSRTDEEIGGLNREPMKARWHKFRKINNVITDYLAINFEGLKSLKQIGIQGYLGLRFCLDGEDMKVGKTGIYELYHEDIDIKFLGFVPYDLETPPIQNESSFILDFKY